MEIIDTVDESSAAPPQEANPAPIDASQPGKQSLGMETLEGRVLLAVDASAAASKPDAVEPPQSPAAYVAQQRPSNVQPEIDDMQASVRDALETADSGSTSGGTAETPAGVNGNSNGGGLSGASSEPHAEVVERPSELKETATVEPEIEDKPERRFDSSGATIEPEGARSPRDREAAQRLVGSAAPEDAPTADAEPSDTDPTELESPELAAAKASVIVSLTSQREQVMDNLGLNPVVDQMADQLGPNASQASSAGQAEHGAAAGVKANDDVGDAVVGQDATSGQEESGQTAVAADADPAGEAVAAYASQPENAVDRAADASRFNPAGDIDNGVPAAPAAHDAVFALGQAMAERLLS